MQTLRKRTSPSKYKSEPSRFLGEGVTFKAKLIGILEVNEARGDRMCQEALADLKMAIRAAGEHKQRIIIHVAIDGLRLRDEKTGDSLYHHPVHKISFIAQDMTDSRAFGYIFGSPDTGHRFFGIKTDKAASQVVIAMRDLFQVVFELKQKEIELAKQHIEQKSRYGGTSTIISDLLTSSPKNKELPKLSSLFTGSSDSKTDAKPDDDSASGTNSSALVNLVDLELELSSIQQGLNQMERITPSDPFGPNSEKFDADPFGDSFADFPKAPFLPPPPSSHRQNRSRYEVPMSSDTGSPKPSRFFASASVDVDVKDKFVTSQITGNSNPSNQSNLSNTSLINSNNTNNINPSPENDEALKLSKHEEAKKNILAQFDVFTELDPLGTGRTKPYVDKTLFFKELKNPPKKNLNDLFTSKPGDDNANEDAEFTTKPNDVEKRATTPLFKATFDTTAFDDDPFSDFDPFKHDARDPFNSDLATDFQTSFTSRTFGFDDDKPMFDRQTPNVPPRTLNNGAIKPPPLPPKKCESQKPPALPPHLDGFNVRYDVLRNIHGADDWKPGVFVASEDVGMAKSEKSIPFNDSIKVEDSITQTQDGSDNQSECEYMSSKSDFASMQMDLYKFTKSRSEIDKDNFEKFDMFDKIDKFDKVVNNVDKSEKIANPDICDLTLTDLTRLSVDDLAKKLNVSSEELSSMTIIQLTTFLQNYIKKNNENVKNHATTEANVKQFDRKTVSIDSSSSSKLHYQKTDKFFDDGYFKAFDDDEAKIDDKATQQKTQVNDMDEANQTIDAGIDRYAALREIVFEDSFITTDDVDKEVEATSALDSKRTPLQEKPMKFSPCHTNPTPNAIQAEFNSPVDEKQTFENQDGSQGSISDSYPELSPKTKPIDKNNDNWASFDSPPAANKHSEEVGSPWSSDSKEFSNGSSHEKNYRNVEEEPIPHDNYYSPYERRHVDRGRAHDESMCGYYQRDDSPTFKSTEKMAEYTRRPCSSSWKTSRHSSSSREVSPWEDEQFFDWTNKQREMAAIPACRHDSWDESEYYKEEQCYLDKKRYCHRKNNEAMYNRSRRRRRPSSDSDHHCCGEWDQDSDTGNDTCLGCHTVQTIPRRPKREDDRFYRHHGGGGGASWSEDYTNEMKYATTHRHFAPGTKKTSACKRPASASEADKFTMDTQMRMSYATFGSDGERDRTYKLITKRNKPKFQSNARSVSSGSQAHAHYKPTIVKQRTSPFEDDFSESLSACSPAQPKQETSVKTTKFSFDISGFNPHANAHSRRFEKFNKFEKIERVSPPVTHRTPTDIALDTKPIKSVKNESSGNISGIQAQFEDNFTPPNSARDVENDGFNVADKTFSNNIPRASAYAAKQRFDFKKSESINIFSRENDPFNDEFFSQN